MTWTILYKIFNGIKHEYMCLNVPSYHHLRLIMDHSVLMTRKEKGDKKTCYTPNMKGK